MIQIMEALRRYSSRTVYVQKTLFKLFGFSSGLADPREDIIKVFIVSYFTTHVERFLRFNPAVDKRKYRN